MLDNALDGHAFCYIPVRMSSGSHLLLQQQESGTSNLAPEKTLQADASHDRLDDSA